MTTQDPSPAIDISGPYSPDDLKRMCIDRLEDVDPAALKAMKRNGELDAYLDKVVEACRSRVRSLLETDQTSIKEQAWSWAVRIVILNRDPD
ncbi:MAG: hypothetical protein OXK21_06400 [Chloroflexota bacterium]|nr:hypothetical protein [Chloroflexota bacterium]